MKLDLKGNEIAIIYNANSAFAKNKARQAHSLVPSSSKTVKATCPDQVQEVLKGLDEAMKNILEKNHPMFRWNDQSGDMDIMEVLQTPLAISRGKAVFCHEATDVYKVIDKKEKAVFM